MLQAVDAQASESPADRPPHLERADALVLMVLAVLGLLFAARVAWLLLTQPPASADWSALDSSLLQILDQHTSGRADVFRPVLPLLLKATWSASGNSALPFAMLVVVAHFGGAALLARVFHSSGISASAAALGALATIVTDATALSAMCLTYHQAAFAKLFGAAAMWEFSRRAGPRAWVWLPVMVLGAASSEQFFAVGPLMLCCRVFRHGSGAAMRQLATTPLLGFVLTYAALLTARVLWHIAAVTDVGGPGSHPLTWETVPRNVVWHIGMMLNSFAPDPSARFLLALGLVASVALRGAGGAANAVRTLLWVGAWALSSVAPNLPTSAEPNPYNVLVGLQGLATGIACIAVAPLRPRSSSGGSPRRRWAARLAAAVPLTIMLVPLHARLVSPTDSPSNPSRVLTAIYKEAVRARPNAPVRMIVADQDEDRDAPCPLASASPWEFEMGGGGDRNSAFAVAENAPDSELRTFRGEVPDWFCVRESDTLVLLRRGSPSETPVRGNVSFRGWEYTIPPRCTLASLSNAIDGASEAEQAYIRAYLSNDDQRASVLAAEVLRDDRTSSREAEDLADWVWITAPARLQPFAPFDPVGADTDFFVSHRLWPAGPGPGTRSRCAAADARERGSSRSDER